MHVLPVIWHRHYDATEANPRQVEFSVFREAICLAGQSVLVQLVCIEMQRMLHIAVNQQLTD